MSDWSELTDDDLDDLDDILDSSDRVTSIVTLDAAQEAGDRVGSLIADEFLVEIYYCATLLLNTLGDIDEFVAEQATTIRSNALVLASEVRKDPGSFVVAVARATKDPVAQYQLVTDAIKRLVRLQEFLADDVASMV